MLPHHHPSFPGSIYQSSPGELIKMKITGSHPQSLGSGFGMGPGNLHFLEVSGNPDAAGSESAL